MRVAMLQAGGKAKRIESLGGGLYPKHLLPTNDGAVIDYALRACRAAMCLPHIVVPRGDTRVMQYIVDEPAIFSYSRGNQVADTAMFGDIYRDCVMGYVMPDTMFAPLEILHRLMGMVVALKAPVVVALFRTSAFRKGGMCNIDKNRRLVIKVKDQPETWAGDLVAWGIIVWTTRFWDAINAGGDHFSDVLNTALEMFGPIPYIMLDSYIDIATVEDYQEALREGW